MAEVMASSNGEKSNVSVATVAEAKEVLINNIFVRSEELIANIVLAMKDPVSGAYIWITLTKPFHSTLVTCSSRVANLGWGDVTVSLATVKEALFEYLLDLLNGKTAKDFFDAQKLKRDNGRQNLEKKRLARKRARAAKRERQRADEKHQTLVKSGLSVRSCLKCSKKFRSRKRAATHLEQCGKTKTPAPVPEKEGTASAAKRARRAKARKQKKQRRKEVEIKEFQGKLEELSSSSDKKQSNDAPVTVISGVKISCEDCEKPAQLYKLSFRTNDKFPKCKTCYPPFPSSEGVFWVSLD